MPKSNKRPKTIYLDYAASTEPNPSSIHSLGLLAKRELENARRKVADILGARKEEIIFTSGGTESNNLVIQGIIQARAEQNFSKSLLPHIITTNIEHPSVIETCRILEKRGLAEVSYVAVEQNGIVNPKKIRKEIKKNTILVSVMYANNEIGTIQPIKEITKGIRHFRKINKTIFPFFHTDAVQAVNYLELDVEKLGVDLLSLSGSKIKVGSKTGCLYKKKKIVLGKVFGGGDQEMGLRPGTENLPGIIKFSRALGLIQANKGKESARLIKLRDYFIASLASKSSKKLKPVSFLINGDLKNRLPNNVNITFPKIPSDLLVIELSGKGIMISAKSACKSSEAGVSYVIKALRPDADSEIGGLRFSFGPDTTRNNINYTVRTLLKIIEKLQKWYN